MTLPTDASLRQVGLAWYKEKSDYADVPNRCHLPVTWENNTVRIPALDRICILAITKKKASDNFTQHDLNAIVDYLEAYEDDMPSVRGLKAHAFLNAINTQPGAWARYFRTLKEGPISKFPETYSVVSILSDWQKGQDTVADTAKTIGNFIGNPVAIIALIIGGGLVAIGVMKLL